MMYKICLTALLPALSLAQAQTTLPVTDQNLINLQTPTLLGSSRSAATVDLRYFAGYDKTLHGDLWLGYGLCKDLEIDLAGSFAKWGSTPAFDGTTIRFGGVDEELSIRYRLPFEQVPITVQAGLDYAQTPAQPQRLAGTLGASAGYSPVSKLRLYLNPKAVFLDRNSLVGIGIGASVDLAPKLLLIADWTPLVAGDNTISTSSGTGSRSQLYGVGLRFQDLWAGGSLDIGVTNATGITTGSSLTPDLGDAPALYIRFGYRF
jgi:hypothetical protein